MLLPMKLACLCWINDILVMDGAAKSPMHQCISVESLFCTGVSQHAGKGESSKRARLKEQLLSYEE